MAKRRKRTNANVPAKGRLRDIADKLWSYAVRDDWSWRCAVCSATKTEAHHLIPRQHASFRYDMQNGIALCSQHHQFDPRVSPHQNAAGWLQWLLDNHPSRWQWYMENTKTIAVVTRNPQYYIESIKHLGQYVPHSDFEHIVGQRFAGWLEEQ